jgi:hypothetical protein
MAFAVMADVMQVHPLERFRRTGTVRPRRSRRRQRIRLLRRKGPSESRDWCGHAMEETMLRWTISVLMRLTRNELCDLAGRIEYWLRDGTVETPLPIRHDQCACWWRPQSRRRQHAPASAAKRNPRARSQP